MKAEREQQPEREMRPERVAKAWYRSKTKWGALLLGLGQVLRMVPGAAEWAPMVDAAGVAVGGFGLRDAVGR